MFIKEIPSAVLRELNEIDELRARKGVSDCGDFAQAKEQ